MAWRDIAEGIAEAIREDEVLHDDGNVSVVVEDKGDYNYQISEALARMGVCVTVAVVAFRRVERSPVLQGTLELEVSCYEHPSLNRDDPSTMTAQGVMERLAKVLHYRRFPFLANQLIFKDFRREDVDEANIARGSFEANTLLGYENAWAEERRNGNDAWEGETKRSKKWDNQT